MTEQTLGDPRDFVDTGGKTFAVPVGAYSPPVFGADPPPPVKAIAAFCKAQADFGAAARDTNNPFFKSKYADLASAWRAVSGALASNGLSVSSEVVPEGEWIVCTTTLWHESGECLTGRWMCKTSKLDSQGVGAVTTYARRMGLFCLLGIVADDDDGNEAAQNPPRSRQEELPPLHQEPRRPAAPAAARPAPPPTQAPPMDKAQDNLRKLWAVAGKLNIKGKVKRDGGEVSSINVNEALWPIVEKIGCAYYGEKDGVGRYIVVRELDPDQIDKLANSLSAYLQELDAGEALEPKA